ncbi:LAMI_0C01310g1_1 [Lachancea mirantina]|uniref:LAMI_0C01310g1_1 n=1 Tax=Lachancea mirantina TaxID=1230905 RepID=A0A1G4J025_9SACH|nr:LAMI_0C01310g1_1 [Lachancea mirantina]
MLDFKALADDVLEKLAEHANTNYRVIVLIVGSPGSGKSTVSGRLCDEINSRFHNYLKKTGTHPTLASTSRSYENLLADLKFNPNSNYEDNESYYFHHVEDIGLPPTKFSTAGSSSTTVMGRGGMPNSIQVSMHTTERQTGGNFEIAQLVPMDGFHLSRKHLDHFKDAKAAHRRRGAPQTFDSNNYLQLCKLLAETSKIKPVFKHKVEDCSSFNEDVLFDELCASFTADVPSISFPGFDHSLKDPTVNQHSVDAYTRVVVMEGLYLLLDVENWAKVFPEIQRTGCFLVFAINVDDATLAERVAKRHLQSGLVGTYEEGLARFNDNDLPNAKLIQANMINSPEIKIINNN